jgi:hypothetical protein
MVAETDEFVAIATEEQALCTVFKQKTQAREPGPKSIRTWRLPDSTGKQEAA